MTHRHTTKNFDERRLSDADKAAIVIHRGEDEKVKTDLKVSQSDDVATTATIVKLREELVKVNAELTTATEIQAVQKVQIDQLRTDLASCQAGNPTVPPGSGIGAITVTMAEFNRAADGSGKVNVGLNMRKG